MPVPQSGFSPTETVTDCARGLTVAVLGLGSIGLRHARNCLSLGATVVGVDPRSDRRRLASEIGVRIAEDRGAALDVATVAVIATPSVDHLDGLSACLGRVERVLVEKPLTHDPQTAGPLLERAKAAGTTVYCGFNLRFHETVAEARRLLDSGELGQILWASFVGSSDLRDWRPGQDIRAGYTNHPQAGGVLFDYCHEIDLAQHLLGPGTLSSARIVQSGTLGLQVEDIATIEMVHPDNVLSTIQLDYCSKPAIREARIRGARATLELDLLGRRLRLVAADGRLLHAAEGTGSFDLDYQAEMRALLCPESVAAGSGAAVESEALAGAEAGLSVSHLVTAARQSPLLQQQPLLAASS